MADQQWTSTEVLAWSRADGPDRSTGGPSRWVLGAVGATLAVTIAGILATDTLCPEHRLWVQTLATLAIVLSITSVVQIMRAQASAGLFALGASVLGVAIGLIDAVHAPERGQLIAAAFGFAALASAGISLRIRALRNWDDDLAVAHTAGSLDQSIGSIESVGSVRSVEHVDPVVEQGAPAPSAPVVGASPSAPASFVERVRR